MTKNKILVLLVAVLLLTNMVLLYFIFNKPHGRGGGSGRDREAAVKEFLQKEIGFTAQQLQQYDSLSRQHKEKMKNIFEGMRAEKEQELKKLAADNFTDSGITQTVNISAAKQREMEMQMLLHYKSTRSLCTPAQQPKFDSLYYKMMWKRGGKKPGSDK